MNQKEQIEKALFDTFEKAAQIGYNFGGKTWFSWYAEQIDAALTATQPEASDDADEFGPVNLNDVEPDDLSFFRKPKTEASDREIATRIVSIVQSKEWYESQAEDELTNLVATIRADERRKAVEAAQTEKVEAVPGSESDEAYNRAIDDACKAILGEGTTP